MRRTKPITARSRKAKPGPRPQAVALTLAYKAGRGPANKRPIVALVERGGNVRTFHVPVADKETVGKIVSREHRPRDAAAH